MSAVTLKRWTREEYDRLIAAGVLSPEERIELLEGDLVRMWPQNPAHALAIRNVEGNAGVADAVQRYPTRFIGFATINPWWLANGVDELKRAREQQDTL